MRFLLVYVLLVQLTGLVHVTSRYFLTGRCHSLTIVERKTVCKMREREREGEREREREGEREREII